MDDESMEAAPDNEAAEGEAQGFKICIYVTPAGAMTYAVEPGGDEEAAAAGTPVKGLPDLMAKIKEAIASGGAPDDADAQFKAGLGEEDAGDHEYR